MPITGREILDRLEAVERKNEGLRKSLRLRTHLLIGAFLGLAVSGFAAISSQDWKISVMRASPMPPIIEAQGFVVKDSRGNVRATLGRTGHATDDRHAETGLQLWTDGKERGKFVVDGHGWGLFSLQDSNESDRLSLVGEGSAAGLSIYDKNGDQRLDLTLTGEESTMLIMNAKDLRARLQMGVQGGGIEPAFINVYDRKEQEIPLIGSDGLPLFSLRPDRRP